MQPELTQDVYVRFSPTANGGQGGVGSYAHKDKKCGNFAFQPGDKALIIPLPLALLAGRAPCGYCTAPGLQAIVHQMMDEAKANAQDPDTEAGKGKVIVTPAAAETAAVEAITVPDEDEEQPPI